MGEVGFGSCVGFRWDKKGEAYFRVCKGCRLGLGSYVSIAALVHVWVHGLEPWCCMGGGLSAVLARTHCLLGRNPPCCAVSSVGGAELLCVWSLVWS